MNNDTTTRTPLILILSATLFLAVIGAYLFWPKDSMSVQEPAGAASQEAAKASAAAPKTLAQARKAVDLKRLDGGPATPRTERKQSKVRATALAHKLGLSA